MVLVDLLTDGNGEDIRWEVTYQKKDPVTGKTLLSFGLDTKKLHDILSKAKTRLPAGLVALAVQCCDEDPLKRPVLATINTTLAQLSERYTQTERVREHLAQKLQMREAQALAASAAIRSSEGTQVWAGVTHGLSNTDVPASDAWEACVALFEGIGPPLLEEESAVICEAAGATQEGAIDAATFGTYWARLEPILSCLRHEQLGWMWRNGLVALFVDRAQACAMLARAGPSAVVFRISSTLPGKLTVSVLKDGRAVHQTVALEPVTAVLGTGKDAKTFDTLTELFLYLHSLGYTTMVGRDGTSTAAMTLIADSVPAAAATLEVLGGSSSGYVQSL